MLASPPMAFYALRPRPMASFHIPDPALETAFIFHPADVFARYQALLQPTQRLREGARVGVLVPARLDYLVFGALPGFFVTRYLFALIAVAPAYLLLRKLYGRSAGALGAIVVLSSPVIITAWGSDYTDSAMVSYLAGALACLAMPCSDRRRPIWVFLGGGLLTMAIWSHLNAVPLAGTTVAVYLLVWLVRGRGHVLKDLGVLAGAALVVTGLLSIASELELGHFNFIGPTWDAYRLLSQSSSVLRDHSRNRRWALYDSYLLVPPAVVLAWAVTFGRRLRAVFTPQLFAGLACAGQVFAFFALQFAGGVQTLELFYLSSPLWGAVCLTVAITMAELSRPMLSRPVTRFLPPALLLVVSLGYEILPHVAPFGWSPVGLALAVSLVVVCAAGVQLVYRASSAATLTATGLSVLLAAALVLVLTVAPVPKHIRRPGELPQPPAPYAAALGGSAEKAVHAYQISSEVPAFVGNASQEGEVLMTWWDPSQYDALLPTAGLYHAALTSLLSPPPTLYPFERVRLSRFRPAQLLVLTTSSLASAPVLRALSQYRPSVVRARVFRAGSLQVHALLLSLGRFESKAHR